MNPPGVRCPTKAAAALCLLLVSLATAAAQEGPLIAVLPFESLEVSASVARAVTGLFETNLVKSGAYTVLSQSERARILEAQETSLADCTDEGCALRIGKLLAAEQIVIGTVAALGAKIIVNAKIIDVATSRTVAADSVSAPGVEGLDAACVRLTRLLVSSTATRLAAAPERTAKVEAETGPPAAGSTEPLDAGASPAEVPQATAPMEPSKPSRPAKPRTPPPVPKRNPAAAKVWSYLALPGALLAADLGYVASGTTDFTSTDFLIGDSKYALLKFDFSQLDGRISKIVRMELELYSFLSPIDARVHRNLTAWTTPAWTTVTSGSFFDSTEVVGAFYIPGSGKFRIDVTGAAGRIPNGILIRNQMAGDGDFGASESPVTDERPKLIVRGY